MKYWFLVFQSEEEAVWSTVLTTSLLHVCSVEQQWALPLYLRFFEDTSSLGLNSFLFGLNSLNSHKETLLKAYKTFILPKSGLTLALPFTFQWVFKQQQKGHFQGLFLVPHLPQRTVLLFCNQTAKKNHKPPAPHLKLMLKGCKRSTTSKGFALEIFVPKLG